MTEIKQDFESAMRGVIEELRAPKNQKNTFGGYSYRSAEDILEALKPLLSVYKLRLKTTEEIVHFKSDDTLQVVELTDSKGKKYSEVIGGDRYYVKSTVTVKGYGEEDSASAMAREEQNKKGMDGAQVTGAAGSYAKKYALNDLFDIDDTKDADTSDNRKDSFVKPKMPATPEQKVKIGALLALQGISEKEEIVSTIKKEFSIDAERMTLEQADSVIKDLEKAK